jgi:hypothetical protein|nr:MAG TPA: hypothetical protein [Caudoviricetes sp.]
MSRATITKKIPTRRNRETINNILMSEKKQNVMLVPSKEKFALSKVKLLKDGGLDVHYEVTEVVGNESYTNKYHVLSAKDIHPDLRKLFDNLRPIMGRVFNITSFKSMMATPDFKATKKQTEIAEAFAEECLGNIEVRGVSLSGQDDNVGVILTGLFTVSNNQKTAINTPRMKFNTETFGFEEELENNVSDIENEVYEFLFNGKKAQLELFGADGEANDLVYVNDTEQGESDGNDMFPDMDDPANDM